jgi:hypothetical protein
MHSDIAAARDQHHIVNEGAHKIKLGESATAGKLHFDNISDAPREYKQKGGGQGPSARTEAIMYRQMGAMNDISGIAAKALSNSIENSIRTLNVAQSDTLKELIVSFREDMRNEVGSVLMKGKLDAKSGLEPITVGDVKLAVEFANQKANERLAGAILKIRTTGLSKSGGSKFKDGWRERAEHHAQARVKRNASSIAKNARASLQSGLAQLSPAFSAETQDTARMAKYEAALDNFGTLVEKEVVSLLSAEPLKKGSIDERDLKKAGDIAEKMVSDVIERRKNNLSAAKEAKSETAAGRPEATTADKVKPEDIPKIAKEKAEQAADRFSAMTSNARRVHTLSSIIAAHNAEAKLKADVEKLATGLLLSDNPGDVAAKIDALVKERVDAYTSSQSPNRRG